MARNYSLNTSEQGESRWLRMDTSGKAGYNFFILVDLEDDGGSVVDVEFAIQDTLDGSTRAIQHHILKNIIVSTASRLNVPITGIRLNVRKMGTGTVNLRVVQHVD